MIHRHSPASVDPTTQLRCCTARIAAAYVTRHHVPAKDLPVLLGVIGKALASQLLQAPKPIPPVPRPAVPIAASITDEWLICLEDGERFKSLRRHLHSRYGLSPEQYRERWSLPVDYPMVAPAYARRRSEIARKVRLGLNSRRPSAPKGRRDVD